MEYYGFIYDRGERQLSAIKNPKAVVPGYVYGTINKHISVTSALEEFSDYIKKTRPAYATLDEYCYEATLVNAQLEIKLDRLINPRN
jgi:hypothetical protein